MGIIDDIYSDMYNSKIEAETKNPVENDLNVAMDWFDVMEREQNKTQTKIFEYFGVKKTEENVLLLPECFKETLGTTFKQIKFSKYISEDAAYVLKGGVKNILNVPTVDLFKEEMTNGEE